MTDPGPVSPRYRALIQLLRTAEDLWNASRVFFARWHLSPSQFNVLNLLGSHPDGLSQSDLSRLLIMHRSNATGLIDRLEARGLVRRHPHPTDRRAYRVTLADPGSALLARIHPHYFAAADRVWASQSAEQVESFLEQLRELAIQATEVAGNQDPTASADSIPTAPPVAPRPVPARRPRRLPRPRPQPDATVPGVAAEPAGLRTSDL